MNQTLRIYTSSALPCGLLLLRLDRIFSVHLLCRLHRGGAVPRNDHGRPNLDRQEHKSKRAGINPLVFGGSVSPVTRYFFKSAAIVANCSSAACKSSTISA